MVIVNNNIQLILNEYDITQQELADEASLSISTVSKTCRRIGHINSKSEFAITRGLNSILSKTNRKKQYTVNKIFAPENFGKI